MQRAALNVGACSVAVDIAVETPREAETRHPCLLKDAAQRATCINDIHTDMLSYTQQ